MSLADDLQNIAVEVRCIACSWYKQLTQEDKDAFDAYVDAMREEQQTRHPGQPILRTAVYLHKKCVANGLALSARQFRNHLADHHVTGR